jgi:hypothetical protein
MDVDINKKLGIVITFIRPKYWSVLKVKYLNYRIGTLHALHQYRI